VQTLKVCADGEGRSFSMMNSLGSAEVAVTLQHSHVFAEASAGARFKGLGVV
jgi:hypothetical protein